MMCIGNMVKLALILENFGNVSLDKEIMILSNKF